MFLARRPYAVLFLLVRSSCNADVGQCDASKDGDCETFVRRIEETTPSPCLKKYSEEHVQASASAHVDHIIGGHEVPHLLLLFGGSGAGKGTLVKHLTKHGLNAAEFVFHGLDEYLIHLPEFVTTINDKGAVYKDAADACYGGGAIPIAVAAQKKIIDGRRHLIYEETGKNLDRVLKRVVPPFEEAGYRITLVLVDNHVEVAKLRASDRFTKEGRYAPADYVEGTFKNVPDNFKKLREMGKVREAVYCDNSCMGDGTPAEDAVKMRSCMKCWRDVVEVPPDSAADDTPLVPDSALTSGPPQYLNPSAR